MRHVHMMQQRIKCWSHLIEELYEGTRTGWCSTGGCTRPYMPMMNNTIMSMGLVHSKLLLLPSESATKSRKTMQATVFTTPYTPVAKREVSVPVIPRLVKIWGA